MARQKTILEQLKIGYSGSGEALKKKIVTFYIADEQHQTLSHIAKKYGISKQDLIVRALENEGLFNKDEVSS